MLLVNKKAVIYGAGGSNGNAVSHAFVDKGTNNVLLGGRAREALGRSPPTTTGRRGCPGSSLSAGRTLVGLRSFLGLIAVMATAASS